MAHLTAAYDRHNHARLSPAIVSELPDGQLTTVTFAVPALQSLLVWADRLRSLKAGPSRSAALPRSHAWTDVEPVEASPLLCDGANRQAESRARPWLFTRTALWGVCYPLCAGRGCTRR